jgi:hypothetical protein
LILAADEGGGLVPWLALHGIDAETCTRLLGAPKTGSALKAPDPPLSHIAPWPVAMASLGQALPQATDILDHIARDVRIDTMPDRQRFPRAFTLHDDGHGLPFVSCPFTGRSSDLLMAAHELGHVCQILPGQSTRGHAAHLPPVLRETAAFLAEELVIAATKEAALSSTLRALHGAHSARIAARHRPALLAAIADPTHPYTYGWNYPIARQLATFVAKSAPPDLQWQVMRGKLSLHDIIALQSS